MIDRGATEAGKPEARIPIGGAILALLAGPLLWAGDFFVVYAAEAAFCAHRAAGENFIRLVIVVVTAATLLAQLVLLVWPDWFSLLRCFRSAEHCTRAFAVSVSRLLTVLSIFGVAWIGVGAMLLDACVQLR